MVWRARDRGVDAVSYRLKKQSIRWLLLTAIVLPLMGCNTMEGLGKDIQGLGKALEDSSNKDD